MIALVEDLSKGSEQKCDGCEKEYCGKFVLLNGIRICVKCVRTINKRLDMYQESKNRRNNNLTFFE